MPYKIKEKTYALVPCKEGTKVLEEKTTHIVYEDTTEIVVRNCYMNGSTLEGRQKGSSYLVGTSYKPPIILNGYKNIILIPTHSKRNKECAWVNFQSILAYYKSEEQTTIIEFKNHTKISINISYSIFDKQISRATRLEFALKGHLNQKYL